MSGISFVHHGSFKKTEKFLKKSIGNDWADILAKYGQQGCEALAAATPRDTGKTASSWSFDLIKNESKGTVSIVWYNDNIYRGINIAVLIQYGHATKNGGWVKGRDYINPALKPIFDQMAEAAWKEVTKI